MNKTNIESNTPSAPQNTKPILRQRSFIKGIGIVLTLLILIGGYLLFNQNRTNSKIASIKSFEDCKKAGYVIIDSYNGLKLCFTPDRKKFTDTTQLNTVISPNTNINPVTSLTLNPANASTWKTFTNGKEGYTLQYPPTYSIPEGQGVGRFSIMSPLNAKRSGGYELQNGELKVEIYTSSSPTNDSLEKIIAEQQKPSSVEMFLKTNNGLQAVIVNSSNPSDGQEYIFIHNLKRLHIVKFPQITSRQNEFEEILSTFRFTEPAKGEQACTQEAKTCPDGSSVGRSGPKCEFAACPK